jgi:hypothetical protein
VIVVPPGAIVGGGLYLAFVYEQLAFSAGVAGEVAKGIAGWLDYLQGETLVAAGKWLAGGALTLAALGSRSWPISATAATRASSSWRTARAP